MSGAVAGCGAVPVNEDHAVLAGVAEPCVEVVHELGVEDVPLRGVGPASCLGAPVDGADPQLVS